MGGFFCSQYYGCIAYLDLAHAPSSSCPRSFKSVYFLNELHTKRVQNGGKKYYVSDVTLICISLKYFSLCATGLLTYAKAVFNVMASALHTNRIHLHLNCTGKYRLCHLSSNEYPNEYPGTVCPALSCSHVCVHALSCPRYWFQWWQTLCLVCCACDDKASTCVCWQMQPHDTLLFLCLHQCTLNTQEMFNVLPKPLFSLHIMIVCVCV